MNTTLEVRKTLIIEATASKVWEVLTDPALIKQFLFGTETTTDWKVGSEIRFQGEWQGKRYEDKGTILAVEPNQLLHHTYWSSMGGTEDKPENYVNVKYILEGDGQHTRLTILQDGVKTEAGKKHLEDNWGRVIEGIKKVAESESRVKV